MMSLRRSTALLLSVLPVYALTLQAAQAGTKKEPGAKKPRVARVHSVRLGSARKEPYSKEGDPAGALPGETTLAVRPLYVDGRVKEWTVGTPHDITERSFAVRRGVRINDALPTDTKEHWVWQRGPWLLVDRASGHVTPIKLPDYYPGVSDVVWFRDYAAYCGVNAGGKHLYAVVAQVAARRPVAAKKLGPWDPTAPRTEPACAAAGWRREPLRVTFNPTGGQTTSFDLVGSSALLVEAGDDNEAPAAMGEAAAAKNP